MSANVPFANAERHHKRNPLRVLRNPDMQLLAGITYGRLDRHHNSRVK